MMKGNVLKVWGVTLILLISILQVVFHPSQVHAAIQTALYVAVDGNDANNGSMNSPFRTIGHARDVVRTLNANMTGDIMVYVRAGTYELANTLSFNELDSGSNGYHVIYRAYDGPGTVTLSGGHEVTGWSLLSGSNSIYTVQVGTNDDFDTLYENGARSVLARTPNGDYSYNLTRNTGTASTLLFTAGDVPPIADLSHATVSVFAGQNYNQTVNKISSIDYANTTINLQSSTPTTIGFHSRYYVQGALELLDEPGEFYLDRATGTLYYWPVSTPIANQKIVIPRLSTLVSIQGSDRSYTVNNLTFDGFSFQNSNRAIGQSSLGSAVFASNAVHLEIVNSIFANLGLDGVRLDGKVQHSRLYGNMFYHIGGRGITLAGTGPVDANNNYIPYEEDNNFNQVENNVIYDVGEISRSSSAITIARSGDNVIRHNVIHDVPRSGINLAGVGNYAKMTSGGRTTYDGTPLTWENHWDYEHTGNNDVSYNVIYNFMMDSADAGGIYATVTGKYNKIDHNVLYNAGYNLNEKLFLLYFDDDTNYTTITNNIAYGHSFSDLGAVNLKGLYNQFSNNILYTNAPATDIRSTQTTATQYSHTLQIDHNIFYGENSRYSFNFFNWTNDTPVTSTNTDRYSLVNDNLYYHPIGLYQIKNLYGDHADHAFTEWQQQSGYLLGNANGSVTVQKIPTTSINRSMQIKAVTGDVSAVREFPLQTGPTAVSVSLRPEQTNQSLFVDFNRYNNGYQDQLLSAGFCSNGQICYYDGTQYLDIGPYSAGNWVNFSFNVQPGGNSTVTVNGSTYSVSTAAVPSVDAIQFRTGNGSGTFEVDSVSVQNGYGSLVADNFDSDPVGGVPVPMDSRSLFLDPLFVDAAHGNFKLQTGSPALGLGFQDIDTTGIGLLTDFPYQASEVLVNRPQPLILNTTSSQYSEQGTWSNSGLKGYAGTATRYSSSAVSTNYAQWNPTITVPGYYRISLYKVKYTGTDPNAKVDISYAGGSDTRYVDFATDNQIGNQSNSDWVTLGTYPLATGSSAFIRNTLNTTGTIARTNAVKLEYVSPISPIIVDNGKPGYTETGTWYQSGLTGYNGSTTRYSTPVVGSSAKWSPTLDRAGNYRVYIYRIVNSGSDPNAKIEVKDSIANHIQYLDYSQGASGWIYLETYNFAQGNAGYIQNTLTTAGVSARADAVKLEWIP